MEETHKHNRLLDNVELRFPKPSGGGFKQVKQVTRINNASSIPPLVVKLIRMNMF